jgi:hypothetical protein
LFHYFTAQGTLFSLKGLLDRKYQFLQNRKLTLNTNKPQCFVDSLINVLGILVNLFYISKTKNLFVIFFFEEAKMKLLYKHQKHHYFRTRRARRK